MDKIVDILTHLSQPEAISRNIEYLVIIVTFYCFVEVVFPPLPGDALLILSGTLSGYVGISPLWVIAGAYFGTFTASALLYSLGQRMERRILISPRFATLLDTKTFVKIEKVLSRYGVWLILASRFIPVIRSGIILAAGMVNLDKRHSLLAVSASILVSTSLFILGGRYLGRRWETIYTYWQERFKLLLFLVLLAVIIGLLVLKVSGYLKNRKKSIEEK
jgi:membrane protein DedA with SNARE-associated domain